MASHPAPGKNRFDLPEWAGAFGDLGTLIPFVAAYLSVLKMDANGLLVAFGLSLIAVGAIYRTPFPVQPMKAIGVAAVSQTALAAGMGSATVVGAALTTGALALPTLSSVAQGKSAEDVPRRSDEKALYLGFFDPADGHVPNPGMGVSGYVHSDHMYEGYPGEDLERRKTSPHPEIDRATFEKLAKDPPDPVVACTNAMYTRSTSGRSSRSTFTETKCALRTAATSGCSNDSRSIT
jgi:hypothetical protein